MRLRNVLIGLAAVVVVGGGCWVWSGRNSDSQDSKSPVLPAVKAGEEVVAEGTVEPVLKAALSLPVSGVAAEVPVKEGDQVVKGQLLLRLDNRTLVAALHQAEAGLTKARANLANTKAAARPQELTIKQAAAAQAWSAYQTARTDRERTQTLFNQQGVSRQELDKANTAYQAALSAWQQAEADLNLTKAGTRQELVSAAESEVKVAEAAVEQAQSSLTQSELRAPFAGAVASLEVKPGEYVNSGAPVLQLADLSCWQIKSSDLTELSVIKIKKGKAADITFDGIPGLVLPGRVSQVKSFGEKKNGDMTYTVTVIPDRTDSRLQWNMTAMLKIKT